MTTYKVFKVGQNDAIEIKGHTGYADSGFDIVCAAISTACMMTNNLIDRLNLSLCVLDLVSEDGYFRFQVNSSDKTVKAVFDNLVSVLDELASEYPKYVKITN